MAHETYWHRRLTEVMRKASAIENQRMREAYLDLAAHYVFMDQLCTPRERSFRKEVGLEKSDPARMLTG